MPATKRVSTGRAESERLGARGEAVSAPPSAPPPGAAPSPSASAPLPISEPEKAVHEFDCAVSGKPCYLPRRVWLEEKSPGLPTLSLTLLLNRAPDLGEEAIGHLIQQGTLNLGVTLRIPDRAGGTLHDRTPAFARRATFELLSEDARVLASAEGSGPAPTGALTADLSPGQARRVLDALRAGPSGIILRARVELDAPQRSTHVRLNAPWLALYSAIEAAATAPEFGMETLEAALRSMRRAGTLRVDAADVLGEDELLAIALRALRQSGGIILARVRDQDRGSFRLLEKPGEWFAWSHEEVVLSPAIRRVEIAGPLEGALAGVLDGHDWSRFVRAVAPDGSPSGYAPLRTRARGLPEREERGDADGSPMTMALVGGTMVQASAMTMTSSPTVRPVARPSDALRQTILADASFQLQKRRDRSLPVVSSTDDAIFPDRLDPRKYWYVPALELVLPDPAAEAALSPFQFWFETFGATTSGEAALRGEVRLTLREAQPEAVARAGNPSVRAVEMLDPEIALSLPYIDSDDGQVKRTLLRSRLDRSAGTLAATFSLADRWVRLCYAVLSVDSYQGLERAKLSYSFRYECYRRLESNRVKPIFGMKSATLATNWSAARPTASTPVFDASRATLSVGALRVRMGIEDEAPSSSRDDEPVRVRAGIGTAAFSVASARPIALAPSLATATLRPVGPGATASLPHLIPKPKPASILVRPEIIDALPIITESVYVQQSIGVQGGADAVLPCARYGSLYMQKMPEGLRPIGCQEAFRLGRATSRLFEEIPELMTEWYRVHRCLQQPGRFLLLPRTYRISRYAPSHERAYQPAASVTAVLDAQNPAATRYVFTATVEPDVPAFALRALRAALAPYAPAASIQIELPTDVGTTELASTSVPVGLAAPSFSSTGVGAQLRLSAALPDALILRSAIESAGIYARLAFAFSDGSRLESNVELLLTSMCGPWRHGPVATEWSGAALILTNRIERPVNISDVKIYSGPTACNTIPRAEQLVPGARATLPVPDASGEPQPIYSIPPGVATRLEESRIFIEELAINVLYTCGINYEARGMAALEVYARPRGTTEEQRVTLSESLPRMGEARFQLPISLGIGTTDLRPEIEHRFVRTMSNGERVDTGWRRCEGAVVDITWEYLTAA